MTVRRIAISAGVVAAVAALALSTSGEALAANNWKDTWKTKGTKTQTTAAHKVGKGKHFLHFGVQGKGKYKWTAKAYRVVGKKGGKDDVLMQKLSYRDTSQEMRADYKHYPKGSYYIVFSYPVKGRTAWGGIE